MGLTNVGSHNIIMENVKVDRSLSLVRGDTIFSHP